MDEVVTLMAVRTFTFAILEVTVVVYPPPSVRVMALVHESDGKLEEGLPVDCAKYHNPAVHVTVLVLPLNTQLELEIW